MGKNWMIDRFVVANFRLEKQLELRETASSGQSSIMWLVCVVLVSVSIMLLLPLENVLLNFF
jgi:hypothetical protein